MGSVRYDRVLGAVIRLTTAGHRLLDRVSKGRLGVRFPGGAQVVWITTMGRRSGQWRRAPLLATPLERDHDHPAQIRSWGIAGSNAGQERVPGWVFNIRDNQRGWIEVKRSRHQCTFEELTGPAADEVYEELAQDWSFYRNYRKRAQRHIPVFKVNSVLQE